jgi:hypothetical protein
MNLDIQKELEVIETNWKQKRQIDRSKYINERAKLNNEESNRVDDTYFDLLKNSTILTGTIFASSIALATGNKVNNLFIMGEFFVLVATVTGILFLWTQLKSREWTHFLNVKMQLEGDLIINKDIMEDVERQAAENLIKDYDRLMDNKSNVLNFLLRIITVDRLPSIFYSALLIGLILIWLSLFIDFQFSKLPDELLRMKLNIIG